MVGAVFPAEAADWLWPDQALARILARAEPLPPGACPLEDANGLVLARAVAARVTLPPWNNAGMDGYALRASEMGASDLETLPPDGIPFPVVGEVLPGGPLPEPPPPGAAVRIMTGAPLPAGLDSVVRVEDTDREAGEPGVVRILRTRDRGRNVRPQGEDMHAGDLLLEAGEVITPGRAALLASAGCDPVPVVPRPRVSLLPTGDELRRPSDFQDVLAGRAIPESNGPMLAAACRAIGVPVRLHPPARDERGALRRALEAAAAEADVLITLGGASMGTGDLVKSVLDELGFRLDFWRIRMRPGSPVSFGLLPRTGGQRPLPVLGLPGNPASAFTGFQLLARPLLLALSGRRRIHRPVVSARAGTPLPAHPDRTLFPRVRMDRDREGRRVAVSAAPQGSGLVRGLGEAQGFAVVPAGSSCPTGTPVTVILLEDGPGDGADPGYFDALRVTEEAP
ncbi:MAG: molybdopterin molybdotransferase MoeA [Longimicrobiales bacterium]|nr:molybdopterin molybdotransferase MoeA [Longimicrobiales bacterium]